MTIEYRNDSIIASRFTITEPQLDHIADHLTEYAIAHPDILNTDPGEHFQFACTVVTHTVFNVDQPIEVALLIAMDIELATVCKHILESFLASLVDSGERLANAKEQVEREEAARRNAHLN